MDEKKKKPDKYRLDDSTDSVYEWSLAAAAYVFCGNLHGRSVSEFISDREHPAADGSDSIDPEVWAAAWNHNNDYCGAAIPAQGDSDEHKSAKKPDNPLIQK